MRQEATMKEYGATLLRLMVGITYVLHAYLVFFVFTPAAWVRFAQAKGIPLAEVLVWYVLLAHTLGGIALIVGLWTRWAALANAVVMLGAVWFVYGNTGFFLKAVLVDAAKGSVARAGYEFELLLLVATVSLIFLGGGALALTRDEVPA
jgi:putative oxidoreductase